MKWLALIVVLASAPAFADKKLEYFGRDQNGAAVVDHGAGRHSVQVGDDVPGWGRVKTVEDDHIVVRRDLSDDERAALRQKGLIPFKAEETTVYRLDQKLQLLMPNQ